MPDPVVIEDAVPATESGAHKALKAERILRKDFERKYHQLGQGLAARVDRLEARKADHGPLLQAMAEWRRDQSAEVGQLRAEVRELADAVDQLRSLIAQP